MCHDSCSSIETAQLFNSPEAELDPMNLGLCPNCAAKYRLLRTNEAIMKDFRRRIVDTKQSEVSNGEQVIIPLEEHEIWFTQTHFAEIQELIKLSEEVKNSEAETPVIINEEDKSEKTGLSVYSSYIGKKISRKDGFVGQITNVDDKYLYVDIIKGEKAEQKTMIQLAFILKNNSVYKIE